MNNFLRPVVVLLFAALSGGGVAGTLPAINDAAAVDLVPTAFHRVAKIGPTAADTLTYQVTTGEVFITDLPPSLDANTVDAYAIIRAPAMSWLVDRSFFWRTAATDAGTHAIRLRADLADAPPDTLTLQIDVTSP